MKKLFSGKIYPVKIGKYNINIGELFRYLIVGGTSAILEMGLFLIFFDKLKLNIILANSLAFFIVFAYGFILQKYWTFKDSSKMIHKQAFKFFVIVGLGFLLNNFLVYLFVEVIGLMPALGKILELGIVFFWNYFGQKLWVFKNESKTA